MVASAVPEEEEAEAESMVARTESMSESGALRLKRVMSSLAWAAWGVA